MGAIYWWARPADRRRSIKLARNVNQHVISKWFLKAFAGGRPLAQFDKTTGAYGETTPEKFMVESDAHSPEVESGIAGRLEPRLYDAPIPEIGAAELAIEIEVLDAEFGRRCSAQVGLAHR